jgi:hypothetical protein
LKRQDEIKLLLQRSEKIISASARKFLNNGCVYEQLLREGRRLVWKTISVNYIVEETFEAFRDLIRNDMESGLGKFIKRIKLKKSRYPWFFDVFPNAIEVDITREKLDEIRKIAIKTRDDNAVKAVIYHLVNMMGIKSEEAPKIINYNTFVENGLQRFLWIFFSNSPYRALMMAYPDLRPEDMKRRPNGYWNDPDSLIKALTDLHSLLESSGYDDDDIPLIINERYLVDHGFRVPLNKFFNGSPFMFLDAAFPGKYSPWQMAVTSPKCFKDDNEIRKMTRWLVETVMKFDMEKMDEFEIWRRDIGRCITKEDFEKNGLRGLLKKFDNSPTKILLFTYPDKFKEWSFKNKDKWTRGEESLELAARATRWVIEDYAKLEPNPSIGFKFFVENGLHGMITSKKLGFNSSPKAVLKNAYPDMIFEDNKTR